MEGAAGTQRHRTHAESHVEVQRSVFISKQRAAPSRVPGPAAAAREGQEGRGDKWTFRTRADGHPICGSRRPHPPAPAAGPTVATRSKRPASSLGAPRSRELSHPLGTGAGGGEGRVGGGLYGIPSPDVVDCPSQVEGGWSPSPIPTPGAPEKLPGVRTWRSRGRNKGSQRAGEDVALPCAPPGRLAGAASCAGSPACGAAGGCVQAGNTKTHFRGARRPDSPARHSQPVHILASLPPAGPACPPAAPLGAGAGNPRRN